MSVLNKKVTMLEVSLPDHIIKFFKLTCRNIFYTRAPGFLLTEYNVQVYKKGLLHGESFCYVLYAKNYGNVFYQKWNEGILVREIITRDVYVSELKLRKFYARS